MFVYFDCAVEDEASVTTETSVDDEQSRGRGQDIRRRLGEITSSTRGRGQSWGRGLGHEMGRGRGQGMGSGHGQGLGSGLGQGGPSGHPAGLPDDVGESEGMLCYSIVLVKLINRPT